MVEALIEFIIEVIIEGCVEGDSSGRIPRYVRIILASILILFYGGLSALLIAVAVNGKNPVLWVLAVGCILIFTAGFLAKYREVSRKRKEKKQAPPQEAEQPVRGDE